MPDAIRKREKVGIGFVPLDIGKLLSVNENNQSQEDGRYSSFVKLFEEKVYIS